MTDDRKLVLIVEDNDKNLKLARDVLQFGGFRTLEATTAEDGIAKAQTERPDLVLMDIQLPGMDGIAALKVLRKDERTRSIPIAASGTPPRTSAVASECRRTWPPPRGNRTPARSAAR